MKTRLILLSLVLLAGSGCGRKHRVSSTNHCLKMDGSGQTVQKANSAWTVGHPKSWSRDAQNTAPNGDPAWIKPTIPRTSRSDNLVYQAIRSVSEFQKTPRTAHYPVKAVRPSITTNTPSPPPATKVIVRKPANTEVVVFLNGMNLTAIEREASIPPNAITCTVEVTRKMGPSQHTHETPPYTVKTVEPIAGDGQLSLSTTTFNGPPPLEVSLRKPTEAEASAYRKKRAFSEDTVKEKVSKIPCTVVNNIQSHKEIGTKEKKVPNVVVDQAILSKEVKEEEREVDPEVLRLRKMFEETQKAIMTFSDTLSDK
jgi:hypothetical protein